MPDYTREMVEALKVKFEARTAADKESDPDGSKLTTSFLADMAHLLGAQRDAANRELAYVKRQLNEALEVLAGRGGIDVSVWSRDCDLHEGTNYYTVNSAEEYHKLINDCYESAEGPMRIEIVENS